MHHNQTDNQCQCTDHFKIEQGFNADAPDFVHVLHTRNARYHRAENDRRDNHFDQLDKTVTERFHR